jgi:hypothetical protein
MMMLTVAYGAFKGNVSSISQAETCLEHKQETFGWWPSVWLQKLQIISLDTPDSQARIQLVAPLFA